MGIIQDLIKSFERLNYLERRKSMEETLRQILKNAKKEALKKAKEEGINSKFEKYFVIGFEKGFKKGVKNVAFKEGFREGQKKAVQKIIATSYQDGQTVNEISNKIKTLVPSWSDDNVKKIINEVIIAL